jgi:restriction system protein
MAEGKAARRRGELVRGAFSVLLDNLDDAAEMPAAQVLKALEERVPPTPFEQSFYPKLSGVRRFEKTVRFATITSVKAGWLVKSRKGWSLTEDGREAYRSYADPEAFDREARRRYREWAKARQPDDGDTDESTLDSQSTITLEEANELAWAEIREYLSKMPPFDFQRLVAVLLEAMGYHVLWEARPGPDGGVDILAHTDPLGATSPRIKVQVKSGAADKISVEGLRAFMAVLGDRDVGIFVAVGGFTQPAEAEARAQEKRRLTLIDLDRFVVLWGEHMDKLGDTDRKRLPLEPVYFLALPE